MLNDLLREYEERFNEKIELPLFLNLEEKEQKKIIEQCLDNNERLYENEYFNDNYMEEVLN